MWKKTLIKPDTPIETAIKVIDRAELQIALVVNENQQLLGTVTDGDIRRAILGRLSLDQPVSQVMNSKPCFIYSKQSRKIAYSLMKSRKIRHVPIVEEDLRLVGLEIADELLTSPIRGNWVIFMAGGLGHRLHPLTESCPKPLLEVGGKPLLETILENFVEQGFRHFYFSVNYKAEMIMEYFGDGTKWAVEIKYLQESQPLGTAGSLGLLPTRPEEPVLLINGDILTKINTAKLLDYHEKNNAEATICIKEHHSQIPYGVVHIEKNRLKKIDEKPVQRFFINSGIYMFNPQVLEYVPAGSYLDIPELIERMIKDGKEIAVFPIREYWIDIGRMDDYERANAEYANLFI